MKRLNARYKVNKKQLSSESIHNTMSKLFPKKNDYGTASFAELIPELEMLDIYSLCEFKKLMKKHRRKLLEIDRDKLEPWEIQMSIETFGKEFVSDALRRQYWFAYPALVRLAMELEFGPRYGTQNPGSG